MIKYEFCRRASQQGQAAFWKAKPMSELRPHGTTVLPTGGDVPGAARPRRCPRRSRHRGICFTECLLGLW